LAIISRRRLAELGRRERIDRRLDLLPGADGVRTSATPLQLPDASRRHQCWPCDFDSRIIERLLAVEESTL